MQPLKELETLRLPTLARLTTSDGMDLGKEYWAQQAIRLQSQQQKQALQNRVNLLKSEEKSLWKMIKNNQKKVQSLFEQKEAVRIAQEQKQNNKREQERALFQEQTKHAEKREKHGQFINQFHSAIQDIQHRNFIHTKEQQIENERKILLNKNSQGMLNKMLYNSVREGHLKGDLSIQKVTARKDKIYKAEYRKRIQSKERETDANKSQILLLEHVESHLLERLNNTQSLGITVKGQLQDLIQTQPSCVLQKAESIRSLNEQIRNMKRSDMQLIQSHSIDETNFLMNQDETIVLDLEIKKKNKRKIMFKKKKD